MSAGATAGAAPSVGEALRRLVARLRETGQDDAEATAEQALAHLLCVPPLDVHLRAREPMDARCRADLDRISLRLARHEPLQYVLGHAEFLGRRFLVDARALIPRPETEDLVRHFLAAPGLAALSVPHLADIGTGSGILAVSLALALPSASITAVDTSVQALDLAQENGRIHGVEARIAWRRGDLCSGLAADSCDGILANLPYVDSEELSRLAPRVRDHEPRLALDGGPGGLALLRRMIPQAARVLHPGGWLALEIGEDQGAPVRETLAGAGFRDIEIRPDLAGHDRIALGRRHGRT